MPTLEGELRLSPTENLFAQTPFNRVIEDVASRHKDIKPSGIRIVLGTLGKVLQLDPKLESRAFSPRSEQLEANEGLRYERYSKFIRDGDLPRGFDTRVYRFGVEFIDALIDYPYWPLYLHHTIGSGFENYLKDGEPKNSRQFKPAETYLTWVVRRMVNDQKNDQWVGLDSILAEIGDLESTRRGAPSGKSSVAEYWRERLSTGLVPERR